jgi:hypothetical protein
MQDFEKLGLFYLGRAWDAAARHAVDELVLYPSKDLTTHAVCIGMTGSGKTGLCLSLVEEAAIDQIPVIAIDPKGDLSNLLLTFPSLDGSAFAPWVEPGVDPAAEAARWKAGLAAWGEDGARIQRLRDAADFAVYTPGSTAGLPLSIVRTFAAPEPEIAREPDLLAERVQSSVQGLLGLAGIDADPMRSREHILLSTIVAHAWAAGRDLDLPSLIQAIQAPPVERVGVMDLESFFPAKERFALAMQLNNLLASPGFAAWLAGEPLDIGALLHTKSGKPRVSILSIAHLSDGERMFFVSLLLERLLGWMRTQSGTSSLRAIFYMDEVFGYFPPVANPPSKKPLLTLLKQARAFGLGCVLATQNPVDLDYKGLANAGTWFIGRLQTERDKARVMDGLEGAAAEAGAGFDRAKMDATLAGLSPRVFLLHSVHADAPTVFQTRWTLSYLRGPLSREQLRALIPRAPQSASKPASNPAASTPADTGSAASDPTATSGAQPVLPPDVPQQFVPVVGAKPDARLIYAPFVLAAASVRFADAKAGIDEARDGLLLAPVSDGAAPVAWERATELELPLERLSQKPREGARYLPPPAAATRGKSYAVWGKALASWMQENNVMELWRSPTSGQVSKPGESEGDFRVRLREAGREARDARADKLRARWTPKIDALEERLRRARQAAARESQEANQAKLDTALSVGATILGSLLGKRSATQSILAGATRSARGVGRAAKQSGDVDRARETVAALEAKLTELEADLQSELSALDGAAESEKLEPFVLKPKKAEVKVSLCVLGWAPFWVTADGERTPAWR